MFLGQTKLAQEDPNLIESIKLNVIAVLELPGFVYVSGSCVNLVLLVMLYLTNIKLLCCDSIMDMEIVFKNNYKMNSEKYIGTFVKATHCKCTIHTFISLVTRYKLYYYKLYITKPCIRYLNAHVYDTVKNE